MGYGATFGILGGGHGPLVPLPPKSAYESFWNFDNVFYIFYITFQKNVNKKHFLECWLWSCVILRQKLENGSQYSENSLY